MPEEKTDSRLYIAIDNETKEPIGLVRATSPSQAARHVAQKRFTVRYAEQEDIFKAAKAGIDIETYTATSE
jgi:hypothetical protein